MWLKQPLGKWLSFDKLWPWYFSLADDCLYHLSDQGWMCYPKMPRQSGRLIFTDIGQPVSNVPELRRATVYRKGLYWVCSGHGEIISQHQPRPTTLHETLIAVTLTERWCTKWIDISVEGKAVSEAIQNNCAIAVSDGSFQEGYSMAAWVIEGEGETGRITGRVIAPGGDGDHSAYQSELAGILATVTVANKLCDFYGIDNGSIEFACDGKSALDKAFSPGSMIRVEDSNYNILSAIQVQQATSKIIWKVRHVYGHQDNNSPVELLDH